MYYYSLFDYSRLTVKHVTITSSAARHNAKEWKETRKPTDNNGLRTF